MNMLGKKLNNKRFTLIELMVVVAVLTTSILLIVPRFSGSTEKARLTKIQNDIRAVENKVHEHLTEHQHFSGNSFYLGGIEEDEVVYSKEGKLDKKALLDKEPFYRVNDLVEDISSKLGGTFIANNNGEAFYLEKDFYPEKDISDLEDEDISDTEGEGTSDLEDEDISNSKSEDISDLENEDTATECVLPPGYDKGEWILVCNADDLNNVRKNLDGKYYQGADIDLSEFGSWEPIGSAFNVFTGTYNGGGFEIKGLTINMSKEKHVGLFGYIQTSTIENVKLTSVYVSGDEDVGGLVGHASWNNFINNSYVNGEINGSFKVGGLVGYTDMSAIERSHATGVVNGHDFVGGLIGKSQSSTIENSYSTGAVTGGESVGGLVGRIHDSEIFNSYATGRVTATSSTGSSGGLVGAGWENNAERSYYDTQTTGQTTSALGTGKTTAQMQDQATYINWDFDTTWQITPNNYPTLR